MINECLLDSINNYWTVFNSMALKEKLWVHSCNFVNVWMAINPVVNKATTVTQLNTNNMFPNSWSSFPMSNQYNCGPDKLQPETEPTRALDTQHNKNVIYRTPLLPKSQPSPHPCSPSLHHLLCGPGVIPHSRMKKGRLFNVYSSTHL